MHEDGVQLIDRQFAQNLAIAMVAWMKSYDKLRKAREFVFAIGFVLLVTLERDQ